MEARAAKTPSPQHPITIEATGARVVVRANGRVVADSNASLTLREGGYPPAIYIPIGDVDAAQLRSSATSTYCPYKGDASYFTIAGTDEDLVDVIWTYDHPYPAVAAIAGHLSFYPDRVDVTIQDPRRR